jgi:plastocyanin
MRKPIVLLATICAAAGLTACGGGADAGSTEPAVVIEVKNMAYTPASVTIEKGQTVQWHFDDSGLPHDVAGTDTAAGKLKSALMTEGIYSHTFDEVGNFTYHCTPHPMMVGSVTVQQ